MKRERHGKAKILTPDEIQLLFNQELETLRDRALFGFCLYTAYRINKACTQLTSDAYEHTRAVRLYMTIRKGNSKGKLASRTYPSSEDLRLLLGQYRPHSGDKYLFAGRWGKRHIHPLPSDRRNKRLPQPHPTSRLSGSQTRTSQRRDRLPFFSVINRKRCVSANAEAAGSHLRQSD